MESAEASAEDTGAARLPKSLWGPKITQKNKSTRFGVVLTFFSSVDSLNPNFVNSAYVLVDIAKHQKSAIGRW